MKNNTILITGATSGIGKVTAIALAKQGAEVLLLARNKEKAQQTKQEILNETGSTAVHIFIADLSSLQQVRHVAAEIVATFSSINILINNAGFIASGKRDISAEGNELTLATNHLGPFLLTALLFPLLKNAASPRIINVSSEAYKIAKVDFANIQLQTNYSAMRAYANSKLYNLLFTKELHRKNKAAGISMSVNALHPGVVNTGFGKTSDGFAGFIFKKLAMLFSTPEQGAETTIYLATDAAVAKMSGMYLKKKKPVATSGRLVNENSERELWDISEMLTGHKFEV